MWNEKPPQNHKPENHYTLRWKIEIMLKQYEMCTGHKCFMACFTKVTDHFLSSFPRHISSLLPFLIPCCSYTLPSATSIMLLHFNFAHYEL